MERANLNGIELEHDRRGHGDPVLLIHGAFIPDAMRPLGGQDALEPFELICYHRRGFAGSSRPPGPTTIADHAADAIGLLDQLGIDHAHVVGHSSGAAIALEMAATEPARISSLALLEPPGRPPALACATRWHGQVTPQQHPPSTARGADGFWSVKGTEPSHDHPNE